MPSTVAVTPANLIVGHRDPDFLAAHHPRHPFILDPADSKARPAADERLHLDQPPVGEYELLLYQGRLPLKEWTHAEWARWISLVQARILQLHRNPHLHHLLISMDTSGIGRVAGYQRVGDLVATSHPIAGEAPLLAPELAARVMAKEPLYVLHDDEHGQLRVPSAPLQAHELWYLPKGHHAGIERISAAEREAAADALAASFRLLLTEFPSLPFILRIQTSLAGEAEGRWWFRMYSPIPEHLALPVRPLPEKLVRDLKLALGS